jgi:ribosome biogenesis GTPase
VQHLTSQQQPTEQGLVVAAYGRRGVLETNDEEQLKYQIKGRRVRVVCGDRVEWVRDTRKGTAVIQTIVDRRNTLGRQSHDHSYIEVLAANLDCIIVVSAAVPETNWYLVDRYLVTAELMNCRALLVDNKIDLAEPASAGARSGELDLYRRLDYVPLGVSAKSGQGIDRLLAELSGSVGILVGQSGVGKSSLINALVPDADVVVGALSTATAEGKQTTTASIMHKLPGGGRLIDTPGVREFVPVIDEASDVRFGFPEISALAGQCRFNDCSHRQEPDCVVKDAVESGSISGRRFETYKRLVEERERR